MQKKKTNTKKVREADALDVAATRRILRKTAEEIPQPSPAVFARVELAIAREDAARASEKPRAAAFLAPLFDRLRDLTAQPGVAWGVAAVQAVVICLLIVFSPAENVYQTLSGNQAGLQSSAAPSYTVMFHENATMKSIKTLLAHAGANIINGPSKKGIYILTIVHGKNREESLKRLKSSSLVTFIEQVY